MLVNRSIRGLSAFFGSLAPVAPDEANCYRLMAENAADMLTQHDARGKVLFAAGASEAILGESASALLGDGLFERIHLADRPAYLTGLSRCLSSGQSLTMEFRLQKANGARRVEEPAYAWVEMRCRPMPCGRESGAAAAAVTRDISDRKTEEEALKHARDEAERTSCAKSQFLANMSHELRTPLNAVIGFSEILDRQLYGALGDKRYLEYARLIHESGQHLLTVVNDVLDMSKIEAGAFTIFKQPFEPVGLLRASAELMRGVAERKDIALRVTEAPGLPELVADKRACKQMLLNLLSNAIKFSHPGGAVELGAVREGEMLRLNVSDRGVGIAREDIARLGRPFVQANASYTRTHDGAGLGLSVVKGLARLHGGRLEIDSTPGAGTTVSVVLPIGNEAETAPPLRRAG